MLKVLKTKKVISIILLSTMLIGLTAIAYGYWYSAINKPTPGNGTGGVDIGEGDTVETTITLDALINPTKQLVPAGRAGSDEVEEVFYTTNVSWVADPDNYDEANDTTTKTLKVECTSIMKVIEEGVEADAEDHFDVTIVIDSTGSAIVLDGSAVLVTITITLNEPSNITEYEFIAGANVIFTFEFSIID